MPQDPSYSARHFHYRTAMCRISTIERQCADALVAAERKIEEAISSRLDYEARARLDALLVDMVDSHLSRFVWLRQ
jgi:hypothetical protein